VNRSKGRILFGNPVQRVKRNDEIELPFEGQGTGVCDLKSKVRAHRRTEVALSESNHVARGIDPDDDSSRRTSGDFRSDFSIAASDIKDMLRAL